MIFPVFRSYSNLSGYSLYVNCVYVILFKLRQFCFVPRDVVVERDDAVEKGEKADDGGRDEEVGVEAEPGEVECDLDPEVVANCIERLQLKKSLK